MAHEKYDRRGWFWVRLVGIAVALAIICFLLFGGDGERHKVTLTSNAVYEIDTFDEKTGEYYTLVETHWGDYNTPYFKHYNGGSRRQGGETEKIPSANERVVTHWKSSDRPFAKKVGFQLARGYPPMRIVIEKRKIK